MTCSHRLGTCVAVVLLATSGCFADAPGTDDAGQTEDGSGGSTSVTTAPGDTGVDADTTNAGVDGTGGNDGSSGDTGACDPEDPECVAPGEEYWTVTHDGGQGHDGAYTIVVHANGDVVVAGEQASGPDNSDPWYARYDADGELLWSTVSPSGEGVDALRGMIALAEGSVLAVGSVEAGPGNVDGYVEAIDAGGGSAGVVTFPFENDDRLFGLVLGGDGGFYATATVGPDGNSPQPALLHYRAEGASWVLDNSTLETGLLTNESGALFGVAIAPDGNVVAVGYSTTDGDSQAMVVVFTAGGDLLDGPATFGDAYSDDFIDVAIDDDGSAIAVGRQGTGETSSDLWIAALDLEAPVSIEWQKTWSAASFTAANGFVRDGDELYIAVGMAEGEPAADAFDAMILRWDGDADEPTWISPYAADSPHRDYAMDVALAPDGTVVACGVYSPDESQEGNAWVRKLAR